nr:glycoside hydrolase family 99-like domain-containing protein [Cellulomonas sp. JZ18]
MSASRQRGELDGRQDGGRGRPRDGLPRTVAFYLPQFHAIPENDRWWGEGFTEWTNVRRARPQFAGHDQPRVPTDLGWYDLTDPEVLARQSRLALDHGVDAFCFYYYWFSGHRLLERPVDDFVAGGVPMPFCLSWANENWTRRWDGKARDVLMAQEYTAESEAAVFADLARYLADPRYLRVRGAAVLLVHKVEDLPDPRRLAATWRAAADAAGVGPLHLVATETVRGLRPHDLGFDAVAEFPPVGSNTLGVARLRPLDHGGVDFRGRLLSYPRVARRFARRRDPDFVRYPGVMPAWDNTARRGERATIFVGSSPELYARWLRAARRREASARGRTASSSSTRGTSGPRGRTSSPTAPTATRTCARRPATSRSPAEPQRTCPRVACRSPGPGRSCALRPRPPSAAGAACAAPPARGGAGDGAGGSRGGGGRRVAGRGGPRPWRRPRAGGGRARAARRRRPAPETAPRPGPDDADWLFAAANPVAHGAGLVRAVVAATRASGPRLAVAADARLADGVAVDLDLPGIGVRSVWRHARWRDLVAAVRASTVRDPRFGRLAWAYLVAAQTARYRVVDEALCAWRGRPALLVDYDRHAYTRPVVAAARRRGWRVVTLVHGSPSRQTYLPVLADHVLVWGGAQRDFFAHHQPAVGTTVVGRVDVDGEPSGRRQGRRHVVLCSSLERLTPTETDRLLAHVEASAADGAVCVLRAHPRGGEPGDGWDRLATAVERVETARGPLVEAVGEGDEVVVVTSTAAVDALLAGCDVHVLADHDRPLPADLAAIRDARTTGDAVDADTLRRRVVAAVGDDARRRLADALTALTPTAPVSPPSR